MASTPATAPTSTSSPLRAPREEEEEEDDDEALFAALEAELDLDSDSEPFQGLGPGGGEVRQDAGIEHRGFLASGDGSGSGRGSGGRFDLEGYRERRLREMREE